MTIKQMFWTLYIAGMMSIFVAAHGYSGALLVFSGMAGAVYSMTLLGGTHNG